MKAEGGDVALSFTVKRFNLKASDTPAALVSVYLVYVESGSI